MPFRSQLVYAGMLLFTVFIACKKGNSIATDEFYGQWLLRQTIHGEPPGLIRVSNQSLLLVLDKQHQYQVQENGQVIKSGHFRLYSTKAAKAGTDQPIPAIQFDNELEQLIQLEGTRLDLCTNIKDGSTTIYEKVR